MNRQQRKEAIFNRKLNFSKSKRYRLQRVIFFPRVEPVDGKVNYTYAEVMEAYNSGKPVASIRLKKTIVHDTYLDKK